jgi:DNA/RNA-binding domain of Phe-tRNA-synthetase-like protein
MLTEDTKNAFMCVEMTDADRIDDLNAGLDHMAEMIQRELGGTVKKYILSKENPEIVIQE